MDDAALKLERIAMAPIGSPNGAELVLYSLIGAGLAIVFLWWLFGFVSSRLSLAAAAKGSSPPGVAVRVSVWLAASLALGGFLLLWMAAAGP